MSPIKFSLCTKFGIFQKSPMKSQISLYTVFSVSPLCISIGKWSKSWEIKLILRFILEQCVLSPMDISVDYYLEIFLKLSICKRILELSVKFLNLFQNGFDPNTIRLQIANPQNSYCKLYTELKRWTDFTGT